jgi:NAD(P)-dependent dehydrogenase (short-subunit alcohol dehydrogenase family)
MNGGVHKLLQHDMQQKNIALVTGSSSGIGFHTSLFLARAGFYTYATMRNLDKSCKILDIAQEDNLPLEVLRLDVTDDKSVRDVINIVAVKQKRIDVVVNNAGYGSTGAVENFSIDEIKAHRNRSRDSLSQYTVYVASA